MSRFTKLLLTAAMAAVTLMALTAIASANRSISVERGERLTFTGQTTFTSGEGTDVVTCLVTLRGSIHRTIAKAEGALVGYITGGAVLTPTCRDNQAFITILGELGRARFPWHILYISFNGTLPNINSVTLLIDDAEFLLNIPTFGITCSYLGDIAALTIGNPVRQARIIEPRTATLVRGSELCPEEGVLEATYTVTPNPRLTLV